MKMISSFSITLYSHSQVGTIPDISSWKIKFRNPDNYIVIIADFYNRVAQIHVTIKSEKEMVQYQVYTS